MRIQVRLSIMETSMAIFQKMKRDTPLQPLCMYQKEMKSAYKRFLLPVLTIALIIVVNIWNQPRYLSMGYRFSNPNSVIKKD